MRISGVHYHKSIESVDKLLLTAIIGEVVPLEVVKEDIFFCISYAYQFSTFILAFSN